MEVSAELEATTLGVAFLAGLATGVWSSYEDVASVARPREVVEPAGTDRRRRWRDAVAFVPAQVGLGTPNWDFGARSLLIGMSSGTGRPQVVRAVLEGVAQRGADLLEAAESDSSLAISRLRLDGGMSANPVFVQALADACQRPVEVSAELEATTLGVAFLAGLATGVWSSYEDVASVARPREVVEPAGTDRRARWRDAVARAAVDPRAFGARVLSSTGARPGRR